MLQGVLQLDATRLARGGFRDIHQHPGCEHLLVKVVRAAARAGTPPGRTVWRRYGVYTPYMREMKEYVAAFARFSRPPPHVQRCFGLVETSLGLGMVVEKLAGADGALAPNLAKVLKSEGISARIWKLYQAFHESVRTYELVINDMHPSNIVLADEDGGGRLVLVDGLGEKAFLPLRTLSPSFNRLKIDRDLRYLEVRMKRVAAELHWPGRFTRETAARIPLDELIGRPPPSAGACGCAPTQ